MRRLFRFPATALAGLHARQGGSRGTSVWHLLDVYREDYEFIAHSVRPVLSPICDVPHHRRRSALHQTLLRFSAQHLGDELGSLSANAFVR